MDLLDFLVVVAGTDCGGCGCGVVPKGTGNYLRCGVKGMGNERIQGL